MKINTEKTLFGRTTRKCTDWTQTIKLCNTLKYLGSIIASTGKDTKDINNTRRRHEQYLE